jgi:hypothetical protein
MRTPAKQIKDLSARGHTLAQIRAVAIARGDETLRREVEKRMAAQHVGDAPGVQQPRT